MRRAAIDVGSNSVLLLIEESFEGGWRQLHEATEVTSLGAGVKKSGLLSEEGVRKTLAALDRFYQAARDYLVDEVLCAATMAARIAKNTPMFLALASQQKTPVIVLSGNDEAELGFLAITSDPTFNDAERLSIVDVGGQSTEVVTALKVGSIWKTEFSRSFPIGTLQLKDGTLHSECPTGPEILQTAVDLDDAIGLCYLKGKCGATVCLGATGTNLVSIKKSMAKWDPKAVHGEWLTFGEISQEVGRLMRLRESERRAIVGIEPGREPTLPAGALILERMLHAMGAPGTFVSTRGWRHALLEFGFPNNSD
jgi:exopolyphosphatase/guanosine-5'-triphosphate,3'-diphosphate pyrophosphatase